MNDHIIDINVYYITIIHRVCARCFSLGDDRDAENGDGADDCIYGVWLDILDENDEK